MVISSHDNKVMRQLLETGGPLSGGTVEPLYNGHFMTSISVPKKGVPFIERFINRGSTVVSADIAYFSILKLD